MPWQSISKSLKALNPSPNLTDYQQACRAHSWNQVRDQLQGLPNDGGLNIAFEAVDRHAAGRRGDHTALRWLGKDGTVRDYSYRQLSALSNRFANVLKTLGVGKEERVFVLAGRIPELYITALGALKNGSTFCPLFSAFGPEPIKARLEIGKGKVLVVTEQLYQRRRIAELRTELPDLEHVLVIGERGEITTISDTQDFHGLLDVAADEFTIPPTDPEDMALLHFTSGTTGKPKGAVHVHAAVLIHYLTGQWVLDLKPDDVFWCTADPGWVTGTSYGIIAPLVNGVTNLVDEQEFNAERWYQILQDQRVNVWYTAPTAIRMLMKYGEALPGRYDLNRLRFLASVGEPLNPEGVVWGQKVFGQPFHDTWWQTETGGIMIANYAALDIKPGSMGCPLPGVEAAIVRRTRLGGIEPVQTPDEEGELALRVGWPSLCRGYLDEDSRYRKCFADGYYLSGDLARRDSDGYYWFVGRADDVIKSAGHLISPFEVESVLLEHPAVAEAGVIGKPDPVAMEIVKAFVALKPGQQPSEELRRNILGFARKRLGPAVAPKDLDFQPSLPKTRSGKIMRRLLKARELGLPEGDLSTLEQEEPVTNQANPETGN
ncbi:MAG: acetate--CoA ligase [Candidatus Competibacteraceae bacterium]|jgi:acetyl-CoA synthetase|nr:acetate--CoA ligase [Candidatus Competibacteraceae bacterium]